MTSRRRAIIAVPLDAIAAMLELPTGLEMHHLFPDSFREAVCLVVTGENLEEVAEGTELPQLPIDDEVRLVDTTPMLDVLREIHRQDGPLCSHCWTWEREAGRPRRATWPCPTMEAAEAEAEMHPLVVRRLRIRG